MYIMGRNSSSPRIYVYIKQMAMTLKEKRELVKIMTTAQKLHDQLHKSSYYKKEPTYTLDECGDEYPDDILLEQLAILNGHLCDVFRSYVKQMAI